jgi:hypothetical protein
LTDTKTENEHAISNAKGWLSNIVEMVEAMQEAEEDGDEDTVEAKRQEIEESALSVQVRGGWHTPGDVEGAKPEEFELLLTYGGPALRVIGKLDEYGQPSEPRVQWQDWGTPWTDYRATSTDEDSALDVFIGCFYYGEG